MEKPRPLLNGPTRFAKSAEMCVQTADVLVIATPWEAVRHLEPAPRRRHSTPRVLIDCWRVLTRNRFKAVLDYVTIGVRFQRQEKTI